MIMDYRDLDELLDTHYPNTIFSDSLSIGRTVFNVVPITSTPITTIAAALNDLSARGLLDAGELTIDSQY